MKRFTLLFACLLTAVLSVRAYTYTDSDGFTWYWTLRSDGETAQILSSTASTSSWTANWTTQEEITVPSEVSYNGATYTVGYIGAYAFRECSSIKKITLPSTITHLNGSAFRDCTGLTEVDLTACTELVSVGSRCFQGCTSLTSIDLSKCTKLELPNQYAFYGTSFTELDFSNCAITSVPDYCFQASSSLTSVKLPSTCTEIGIQSFYECTALASVDLSNVTTIGQECFYECTSLESIDLSSLTGYTTLGASSAEGRFFYKCTSLKSAIIGNVETMLHGFFQNCYSLTSIEISESVTSIGSYCFYFCMSLESIEIPESVTSIGNSCFSGCTALTKVKVYAEAVPTLGSDVFYRNADGRTIYVPPFSLASYQAASNWSSYASYINPFVDQTVSGSAGMGTIALPFEATIPDGLTAYTVGSLNDDGTEVALTAVSSGETLAAGTPCIVMISSDEEESDDDTATASEDEETTTTSDLACEWLGTTNALGTSDGSTAYVVSDVVSKDNAYGVFQTSTLAAGDDYTYYILQQHSGDETPKFYKVGSTSVTVGAYRAYLALSSSASSAESIAFTFVESDEVTGIGSVSVEQTVGSGLYYDLQGRQVKTPQKGGIYIKDGKKVVI